MSAARKARKARKGSATQGKRNGKAAPAARARAAARPVPAVGSAPAVLAAAAAPTSIGVPTGTTSRRYDRGRKARRTPVPAAAPAPAPAPATLVAAAAPAAIGVPTRSTTGSAGAGGPVGTATPAAAAAAAPAVARAPAAPRQETDRPEPVPEPAPEPAAAAAAVVGAGPAPGVTDDPSPTDRTPEDAFDRLYRRAAGGLLRQVEVLTGDPEMARHAVTYAYDLAWQRWPEVARDSDPVGWLRAAAYEHALAPWQRWLPGWAGGRRPRTRTPADPLAAALLALPPARRKAVLLYDGLGLDLPAAAVEAEASEEAAAARIVRAREALTGALPDLSEEALPARLGALLDGGAEPEPPGRPAGVRAASEREARRRTFGAYALTAVIAAATTAAVILTPGHQSVRDSRQPAPGTHATAGSGAPAQHGGAGPLPSGRRTRAVRDH